MAQLVTRVDEALADEVDRLVREGVVESRSDAVRRGLEALIDQHRRAAIGASIVEGYRRVPDDGDVGWSDAATRRMITDEPW
ncbi:MAG: ribbon-helix-helix domain-containing protein [Actinomycetota bacterium]